MSLAAGGHDHGGGPTVPAKGMLSPCVDKGNNDAGVYGGPIDFEGKVITIRSTRGSEHTTIVPPKGGSGPLVLVTSGEGVDSILDGFTIEGGNAQRGGMLIFNAQPTILNCIFRDNTANQAGAAVDITNGASDIINCIFIDNRILSTSDGGGPFGGRAVLIDGGSPRIANCTFLRNDGVSQGGAILIESGSAPVISNSLLWSVCESHVCENQPTQVQTSHDRGRQDRLPGPAPLRTVRADLPHTALQSVVHRRAD